MYRSANVRHSADTGLDLDGGGAEAQTWWEAPCADTKSFGSE